MIQITRTKRPLVLGKNSSKWLKDLRHARTTKDKTAFKKAQGKYAHPQVRDALDSMFHGKCAYCESTIEHVATSHIEHYRPKSKYLSLTFDWNNLLLCCPKCNNKAHKGTKFPKSAQNGPIVNPTAESPSSHFDFFYDSTAELAVASPISARGTTTEDIFKLNSRKELVRVRTDHLKKLIFIKQFETTDPEAARILAEARKDDRLYLAWVKALNI